jgi:hypothetical protein
MRGLAAKLIFFLIVYFAGFATAIYMLAPVPKNQARQAHKKGFVYSALKSDEFANSFNEKMHYCIDYSKNAVNKADEFVKQKLTEK